MRIVNDRVLGASEGQAAHMLASGVREKYVQQKKVKKHFSLKVLENIRALQMRRPEKMLTL